METNKTTIAANKKILAAIVTYMDNNPNDSFHEILLALDINTIVRVGTKEYYENKYSEQSTTTVALLNLEHLDGDKSS